MIRKITLVGAGLLLSLDARAVPIACEMPSESDAIDYKACFKNMGKMIKQEMGSKGWLKRSGRFGEHIHDLEKRFRKAQKKVRELGSERKTRTSNLLTRLYDLFRARKQLNQNQLRHLLKRVDDLNNELNAALKTFQKNTKHPFFGQVDIAPKTALAAATFVNDYARIGLKATDLSYDFDRVLAASPFAAENRLLSSVEKMLPDAQPKSWWKVWA